MFSSSIPKSTGTLASEMFTRIQWATIPLRFLVVHLVVSMPSKKRVVLNLNTKLKAIKASEKDKVSVK
jgi:hypothetical protein